MNRIQLPRLVNKPVSHYMRPWLFILTNGYGHGVQDEADDARRKMPTPPAWVFQRIKAKAAEPSLYGPVNAVLTTCFPVADMFLVKPQAIIRAATFMDWEPEDDSPNLPTDVLIDDPRLSLDSYHAIVASRDSSSVGAMPKKPDFVVAKATESQTEDIPLLIVEIKKDATELHNGQALNQILAYFEHMAAKHRQDNKKHLFDVMHGVLIGGGHMQLIEFPITENYKAGNVMSIKKKKLHDFLQVIYNNNVDNV
ncbi:hypothetical protein DXG01_009842 [Tephrocybe rancida]|nr:hypothetical protein DXG01_009842 [Tephrocybe rancida]